MKSSAEDTRYGDRAFLSPLFPLSNWFNYNRTVRKRKKRYFPALSVNQIKSAKDPGCTRIAAAGMRVNCTS